MKERILKQKIVKTDEQKKELKTQILLGEISQIILKSNNPSAAAKKIVNHVITKDAYGISVPTTFTPSSPSPAPNIANSASVVPTSTPAMYWPAPQNWYQQGFEAAKKAYIEYVNAANQYQQEQQNQDRKLEMAGRMNLAISSIIQGLRRGTEAGEGISQSIRT